MRIEVTPRLIKSARRLGPEVTLAVEKCLKRVAARFGDPHAHAGLGLRKLGRCSYEARVHLRWRVIFLKEPDVLVAYDIMNHDEVAAWLKARRGR